MVEVVILIDDWCNEAGKDVGDVLNANTSVLLMLSRMPSFRSCGITALINGSTSPALVKMATSSM
jgi:hypothetical protein